MDNLRRALRFFRPDTPRIAIVLLLSIASIAANVLKPWPVALIVDSVLQDKPLPRWLFEWKNGAPSKPSLIATFTIILFAIYGAQALLSAAQNFTAIQIGLRGLRRVRSQVFATLSGFHCGFITACEWAI